jgi:regulator of sirC expression with transglutaminase-like and TPR domain
MSEAALRRLFEHFRSAVEAEAAGSGEGERASLLDAALLVAMVGRSPDAEAVETALEGLAVGALAAVPTDGPLQPRLDGLCGFLARGRGFGGEVARYNEVDNSLLDRVLATGRGIPITLAVVYVEVGRRLGLECEGVNFPGHFLVRFRLRDEVRLVDPFEGRVLEDADCLELLRRTQGPAATLREEHLQRATPLNVLVRMLNNLKQLAIAQKRWWDGLRYSELILLAEPGLVLEHGERAAMYERLGEFELALVELQLLDAVVDDVALRARLAREMTRVGRLGQAGRTLH